MTYTAFITKYLLQKEYGCPIFTEEIAEALTSQYGLEPKKASAATSVALKRIIDGNKTPDLRCYQKGIYYRAETTPFGETGISRDRLVAARYLRQDSGYETGLGFMHRLGLTSQMPVEQVIATNSARNAVRHDAKLNVSVRPPKTTINSGNKRYLLVLDVLEMLDKAPIDATDPYAILAEHICRYDLQYDILLYYADKYYNKHTVIQLAHIAGRKMVLNESD